MKDGFAIFVYVKILLKDVVKVITHMPTVIKKGTAKKKYQHIDLKKHNSEMLSKYLNCTVSHEISKMI